MLAAQSSVVPFRATAAKKTVQAKRRTRYFFDIKVQGVWLRDTDGELFMDMNIAYDSALGCIAALVEDVVDVWDIERIEIRDDLGDTLLSQTMDEFLK